MDLRPFGYEPQPALRPKTLKATPLPRVGLSRTERDPRALSHLRGGHAAMHQLHSDGHLREAPDITDVSAGKPDADFENGDIGNPPSAR